MPLENVEIAERLGDVWTTADWAQVEQHFWPGAEAQAPEGWPEAVDEDTVLQHGHWRGHGKESGLELDLETWIIYRFRDGKVSRMEFYIDRDQAMSARGL